jgi:hypothetical protein
MMDMDEATRARVNAEMDARISARGKEAWSLSRRQQVDAAVKLVKFDPDWGIDRCRWYVEGVLARFEEFDFQWRVDQPVTKDSKRAARRLANALSRHVEVAMKDPNLGPEFRLHDRELLDLRLRAEKAAKEKIGSKKGRLQREAVKRRLAVECAEMMMTICSCSDVDKFSRFVKLANLIYSGKAEESDNFRRLVKEISDPDKYAGFVEKMGEHRA